MFSKLCIISHTAPLCPDNHTLLSLSPPTTSPSTLPFSASQFPNAHKPSPNDPPPKTPPFLLSHSSPQTTKRSPSQQSLSLQVGFSGTKNQRVKGEIIHTGNPKAPSSSALSVFFPNNSFPSFPAISITFLVSASPSTPFRTSSKTGFSFVFF